MLLKDIFVPKNKLNMKDAIISKGMKQKYIAKELGISESHLSRMINGFHPFQEKYKEEIAEMLSIPRNDIV